jgi:hypothetical protein
MSFLRRQESRIFRHGFTLVTNRYFGVAEMNKPDRGYKYLVEVMLNLNHDRFKTYFNTFLFINSGLILASIENIVPADVEIVICAAGVLLSVIWILVHIKLITDIRNTWKKIEDYEKDTFQKVTISKVNENHNKKVRRKHLRRLFIVCMRNCCSQGNQAKSSQTTKRKILKNALRSAIQEGREKIENFPAMYTISIVPILFIIFHILLYYK